MERMSDMRGGRREGASGVADQDMEKGERQRGVGGGYK